MNPTQEKNMDFSHMTIGDVEKLVGRKAANVELKDSWIECFFAGTTGSEQADGISDVTVSFKRW